ncbi:hypothetical protein BDN70DRAFT_931191 [Pholiota conissans]|uniref:Uncharacterized protein n=1 Tax=Pholiota conissans TaxID=109636 RepID=A0A9P6D250_9AGAR|nr:hypothetical protein BDN70DRAFT_931191 [Pholiota conissans]
MHLLRRQTEREVPTSIPTFPTSTGSDSQSTDTGDVTTDTGTSTTDITDPPISPTPPITVTNTTTSTTTSDTTSDTTTTTTTTSTTTPKPDRGTDTTTSSSSNTSPAPITPPPAVFTPPATSLPSFNDTSSSVTANFTTLTTSINGQATTITSQLPTALINFDPSHDSDEHRTTVIAGTTTGLFIFVCSVLAAIFVYRRHKLRKALATSGKRKEGRGLLDGEDFDDDDVPPQMRSLSSQRHSLVRSVSPAPSLLKSRVSETGSIFREEIWPPPGFVDPISKRSSQVDLSKIVDDVMGPTHERNVTTASGSSESNPFLDNGNHHHRQASSSSLLDNDPFATTGQSSLYSSSYLPPGASPPVQPGLMTSSMIPASRSAASFSQSPSQMSTAYMLGSGSSSTQSMSSPLTPARPLSSSTQPKKSSPLARALSDRDKILFPGGPAPPAPSVGPLH